MLSRSLLKKILVLLLPLGLLLNTSACGTPLSPEEDQVVQAAGYTSQALEYTMLGLGFLAPSKEKTKPTGKSAAIEFVKKAVRTLLKKCVEGSVLTTSKSTLQLKLPKKGCSIPLTGIKFQGEIDAKVSKNSENSALSVTFKNFSFFKTFIDGKVYIENNAGVLHYKVSNLTVKTATISLKLEGEGIYQPSFDKLGTTFSGKGTIEHEGAKYEFEAKDINRSYINGCYPKSGTLKLKISPTGSGLGLEVILEYNNDLIGGLDSNDTGKAYITFNGIRREIALQKRTGCLESD